MRANIYNNEIYLPEPVGKQPKYWLLSYGKRYLYKKSTLKHDGSPIYNDVSECLAMEIAKLINIPTAEYYLCKNGDELGVITPDFLDNDIKGPKREEFYDGVYLIEQIDPGFKNTSLINPKTHQYYTVDLILRSVAKYGLEKDALKMIVFDALIGNRDRNPSNYGIIINHETKQIRFSPLYDSCASLGVSMVNHRLANCFDEHGLIVDEDYLKLVIHHHIVGKVTLDRSLQYKDKIKWDKKESSRILTLIEEKRKELLPLLESNQISFEQYHKILNKVGNEYRKYDISTLEYQTLISYLTLFYPDEISDVMNDIANNINEQSINQAFDYYKNEIPIDRLNMAKSIVLERSLWMVDFYYKNRVVGRWKTK